MNTKDEQAMISRIVDLEKRVKTLTAERVFLSSEKGTSY